MTTTAEARLPEGLYRPGPQFTAAELQVLTHESALRPVIGDVYASVSLPDAPGLRALSCQALLCPGLRAEAVLCGETAAWIHLGGAEPPLKIAVITDGVFRRMTAAEISWQVHQVRLEPGEVIRLHEVPVTTELRTAADLFLGLGTFASRRPLDLPIVQSSPAAAQLQEVRGASAQRWTLIRSLVQSHPGLIGPEELTEQITAQLRGSRAGPRRRDRIAEQLQSRIFGKPT